MADPHHRKRRSQGGDDSPVNVIQIDRDLHDWIHANPQEAFDRGLLVPEHAQPEDISIDLSGLRLRAPRRKPEAKRERVNTTIRTPKDEVNVLPDLIEECRRSLVPQMGWQEDVPNYFVLTAVCVSFLQAQGGPK